MPRRFTRFHALVLALVVGQPVPAKAVDNFLVIILDDVGVDKIGAYRDGECVLGECPSPPPTPNIDTLASQGLLFRNAWSTPLCSATRVTLMTGRYPFRTRVGSAVTLGSQVEMGLDPNAPNIANALKFAGYDTAAFGKWHMTGCELTAGECTPIPPDFAGHPIRSGFDYFSGSSSNLSDYCDWQKIESQRTGPGDTDYTSTIVDGYDTYATVDTVDAAIAHIPLMTEPWLAWVSFNASHAPTHNVPVDPQHCQMDEVGVEIDQYAEMTTAMDSEIGRLLASLASGSSRLDRTTILVIGDNGTYASATEPPFVPGHGKNTVYEGGANVPFIVSGPQVGPLAVGAESAALVNTTDLFATLADVAGINPCPSGSGCAEDSLSWLGQLQDPAQPSVRTHDYTTFFRPLDFRYSRKRHQAVRNGSHKLIHRLLDDPVVIEVELYDLSADPWESTNLLDAPLSPGDAAAFSELGLELNALVGVCAYAGDSDADCVPDMSDNCPSLPNGPLEAGEPGWGDQADGDGDGLGDRCDLDDANNPDEDGDGLLDVHETGTGFYVSPTDTGTDFLNPDSDGDLVSDGNEVTHGSDPNDAASLPVVYTEKAAFLSQLVTANATLDFEGFSAAQILSNATIELLAPVNTDVTLPPSTINVLDPGGPALDLVAVENTGDNAASSGSNSMGADDGPNFNKFILGAPLAFAFDPPILALGLSVISTAEPGVSVVDDDLELELDSGISVGLTVRDGEFLEQIDGVDYYAYFLGAFSPTVFSAAELKKGSGAPDGGFSYNIDDLVVVPEGRPLILLAAGCTALLLISRLRRCLPSRQCDSAAARCSCTGATLAVVHEHHVLDPPNPRG